MSLSDLLNISRTVRRDKARDQDLLPTPTSTTATPARLCNICYANPATYNCPRCNIPYCSLVCFRKREHQDCLSAFSSSEINLAKRAPQDEAEEGDRNKVLDILGRLERDEKQAKLNQQDSLEDDDSTSDEEGLDERDDVRAEVTKEQIETASTDALLAMLTPRERWRFMTAIKSPDSAAALMQRLDRKADRDARLEAAKATPHGVLITSQPSVDHKPALGAVKTEWQSTPWFERSTASPHFSDAFSKHESDFVETIRKIFSTTSASNQDARSSVNLVYNLCTVIMAYAYTLRHLDVPTLSHVSNLVAASSSALNASSPPATSNSNALNAQVFVQSTTLNGDVVDDDEDDYDDEPPPLEPDEPITQSTAFPLQPTVSEPAALPPVSESQKLENRAIAEEALNKLDRLLPFLFSQPAPPTASRSSIPPLGGGRDPSKVVLTSLDDASMWLLSRLCLDSDLGQGGVDALDLQLVQDLVRIFAAEQLVPTFNSEDQVEPKYRLASKFASLPPQYAFAAAQTPLVLNAVADLYFFLQDMASLHSHPDAPLSRRCVKLKNVKLAQRKLCFYLCNAMLSDQSSPQPSISRLGHELQSHIDKLQHRIEATQHADKLAAAFSLLNNESSATRT